jgi:GT2 family glycosyltransferase
MSGDVSVIVVNWNSGDCLRRCLHAVGRQTSPPARVIVIDNASTDDSIQRARPELPMAEFIVQSRNTGFAAANNAGIRLCPDSDWVCLLNPDAFPEPGWLEALCAAAGQDGFTACASLILRADGSGRIDSAGDRYLPSGIGVHRLGGQPLATVTGNTEVFAPCAAAALYRRDVLLAAGGFDDDLFAFYEDVDLGVRLRLMGQRTLLAHAAVVHHVGGGSSGADGERVAASYGLRNLILVFIKDMPGYLFWSGLPRLAWAVTRALARGVLDGRGLLMVRAVLAAVIRVPRCLVQRRRVQAARRVTTAAFRVMQSL